MPEHFQVPVVPVAWIPTCQQVIRLTQLDILRDQFLILGQRNHVLKKVKVQHMSNQHMWVDYRGHSVQSTMMGRSQHVGRL